MFKKLVLVLAALAVSSVAQAAYTQVKATDVRQVGPNGPYYGRSDGVFIDTQAHGLEVINNGTYGGPLGQSFYEDFTKFGGVGYGISCIDVGDGSTCVGDATTVPGMLSFTDGFRAIQFPVVTATIPVTMAVAGLDITGDLTDNDGFEIVTGILGASGRPFLTGTDPAFYSCATITIADVTGSDFLFAGFRVPAAMSATPTYTDFAAIGNVSGEIYTKTNKASGGIVSTDTTNTWADAATKKLCVNVSSAGVVTYTVDGAEPTTVVGMTFTTGTSVIPFIHLRHDADIAEATIVTKWEVGYSK